MTPASSVPFLTQPGRSRWPLALLLASLVLAAAAALGLHKTVERYRAAGQAESINAAATQWTLLLARLENRILAFRPELGGSDTTRFQHSAAALRREWPGALREALLYAAPAEPTPHAAAELAVVSVASGLPRGGPEHLGQALPPAIAEAVRSRRSDFLLQAELDPAEGSPQLLLLAVDARFGVAPRTIQAYRFDAQRLAELAIGSAAAPQLLPSESAAGSLAADQVLIPLNQPAVGWVLRLNTPGAAALAWLTPMPWLVGFLVAALGGLGALVLWRRGDGAPLTALPIGPDGESSENRLLDFIELSADWLWESDAEHRFTLVTGGFLNVARLDPKDYLGKHRWDIDYLGTDAVFWAQHRAQLERREPVRLNLCRYNLDGEIRHLEVIGKPMFDGLRFLGYRGVGRDVTAQRVAAEALRASEARFRDLVELSSDWYWEQDAEFRYTGLSSNPRNQRPAELSQLLGHTPWELAQAIPTDPPWAGHIAILRRHRPFNNFVYESVWFDGEPIWFSVSGRPIFGAAGEFLGYRGVATDITEERMAQEALSESESRYRQTFEHAPVGIATLSPTGIWQSVNDTTCEMLGYRRAELVSQPYGRVTHSEDQARDREDLQQLTEGLRDTASREKRFIAKDGSLVWCRVTLSAQRNAYGTTRSLICVMEDITDRVAALQALRSSEERYRRLVEMAPDGVFVHCDDIIQFANPAALSILGAGGDAELVGKSFLAQVDGEFRSQEEAYFQALASQGPSGRVPAHHLRLRRLDGSFVDVEASAVAVDLDYRPAALCMLRDITERLAANRALVDSQSRYRDVVESVNEVIFQADAQGRFTFLNQAWRQITGFPMEESLGCSLIDFLHPDDRGRARNSLDEVLAGIRAESHSELRIRTRDGQIRWIEAVARQARGGGISGSLDDISSRKIAELTLRNLNRELEARVKLRTAELENSNRELEAFSYSVSHDLRAPLRAIDGFAHIIEEDYAEYIGPAGRAYLTRIRKATHRMAELIDDLIELARLTRQTLHRQEVDVSELVTQIMDELRAEAPEREVALHLAPGLRAHADRALLRAVLENLLRNAWKFTAREAHPEITVSADEVDGKVTYCVADNGVGFDMAFANKLFRPFHRLHDPAEFSGTGIGLATVERIIQRHGGHVWAESSPGQGARFYFTLG